MNNNKTTEHAAGGQLGTFTGVFTPSILTILGIILFCAWDMWWAVPGWVGRWSSSPSQSDQRTYQYFPFRCGDQPDGPGRRRLLSDFANPGAGVRRFHRPGAIFGPKRVRCLLLHWLCRSLGFFFHPGITVDRPVDCGRRRGLSIYFCLVGGGLGRPFSIRRHGTAHCGPGFIFYRGRVQL